MAFYKSIVGSKNDEKEEITFATVKSYIRSIYDEARVPYLVYELFENNKIVCGDSIITYKHDKKHIQILLGIST